MRQFTRLLLSNEEIYDVLDDFTDKAHIPLVEGVIQVVAGDWEIQGIYSELIKSSFIISRV
jgi:hypothetical protein